MRGWRRNEKSERPSLIHRSMKLGASIILLAALFEKGPPYVVGAAEPVPVPTLSKGTEDSPPFEGNGDVLPAALEVVPPPGAVPVASVKKPDVALAEAAFAEAAFIFDDEAVEFTRKYSLDVPPPKGVVEAMEKVGSSRRLDHQERRRLLTKTVVPVRFIIFQAEEDPDTINEDYLQALVDSLNSGFRDTLFAFIYAGGYLLYDPSYAADCFWPGEDFRLGGTTDLTVYFCNTFAQNATGFAYLPPLVETQYNLFDGVYLMNPSLDPANAALIKILHHDLAITHEAGHYLGLMHTFQGTKQDGITPDGCNTDVKPQWFGVYYTQKNDGCPDTPSHLTPTWNVPIPTNCFQTQTHSLETCCHIGVNPLLDTCADSILGIEKGTDPVDNYMNYIFPECAAVFGRFTSDQNNRLADNYWWRDPFTELANKVRPVEYVFSRDQFTWQIGIQAEAQGLVTADFLRNDNNAYDISIFEDRVEIWFSGRKTPGDYFAHIAIFPPWFPSRYVVVYLTVTVAECSSTEQCLNNGPACTVSTCTEGLCESRSLCLSNQVCQAGVCVDSCRPLRGRCGTGKPPCCNKRGCVKGKCAKCLAVGGLCPTRACCGGNVCKRIRGKVLCGARRRIRGKPKPLCRFQFCNNPAKSQSRKCARCCPKVCRSAYRRQTPKQRKLCRKKC